MKRFIEGENRSQSTLLPERLDDYIAEDNRARISIGLIPEVAAHKVNSGAGGREGPLGEVVRAKA